MILEDGFLVYYSNERVEIMAKYLKFTFMIKDAAKHIGTVWASENDHRI